MAMGWGCWGNGGRATRDGEMIGSLPRFRWWQWMSGINDPARHRGPSQTSRTQRKPRLVVALSGVLLLRASVR